MAGTSSSCNICPCTDWEPNTFNPKMCRNCLHKHVNVINIKVGQKQNFLPSATSRMSYRHPSGYSADTPNQQDPIFPTNKELPKAPGKEEEKKPSPSPSPVPAIPTRPASNSERSIPKKAKKSKLATFLTFNKRTNSPQMSICGPTDVKHEGHMGFSKTGIEESQAFNLPPDWQNLMNNLNNTLRDMGVDGLTEEEARLLLTGKLEVEKGEKTKMEAGWTDRNAIQQKKALKPQRTAGFTIGRRNTVIEEEAPTVKKAEELKEPNWAALLQSLQIEVEEKKQMIVRLQTESKSMVEELEGKNKKLTEICADQKTKLHLKGQDISKLKIENHSQHSQIEKLTKEVKQSVDERNDLLQLNQQGAADSTSRFTKEREELLAQHKREVSALKESVAAEQSKTRILTESHNQLDMELSTLRAASDVSCRNREEVEEVREVLEGQVAKMRLEHQTYYESSLQQMERMKSEKEVLLKQVEDLEDCLGKQTKYMEEGERKLSSLERQSSVALLSSDQMISSIQKKYEQVSREVEEGAARSKKLEKEKTEISSQLEALLDQNKNLLIIKENESKGKDRAVKENERLKGVIEEESQKYKTLLSEVQARSQQLEEEKRKLEMEVREMNGTVVSMSKAEEHSSEQAGNFEKQLASLHQAFSKDLDEHRDEIRNLKKQTGEAEEEGRTLRRKVATKEAELLELSSELAEATHTVHRLQEEIQCMKKNTMMKTEELQVKVNEIEGEKHSLENELSRLRTSWEETKQSVISLTSQVESMKVERERVEAEAGIQNEKYSKRLHALKQTNQDAEKQISSLKKEKRLLEMEISGLKINRKASEQMREKLDSAQKKFDDELHRMSKSKGEKMQEIQEQLEKANEGKLVAEEEAAKLHLSLTSLTQKQQSQENQAESSSEQVKHWETQVESVKEELMEVRADYDKEKTLRFQADQEIIDLTEEMEQLQNRIDSQEEDISALRVAKTELEVITKQQMDLLESLSSEPEEVDAYIPTPPSLKRSMQTARLSVRPGAPPLSVPPPPSFTPSGPSGSMFDEIKSGKNLKKVEVDLKKDDISKHYDDQNVLHVLARALIARRQGVEGDKASSNATDDQEDDWE